MSVYFGYCTSYRCHKDRSNHGPSSLGTLVDIRDLKKDRGLPSICSKCGYALFWHKDRGKYNFCTNKAKTRKKYKF